mmetsp:Transcript_10553/g.16137  ORF Transcript_10553/g.16137 Transcript_10553/m.16137 type:complete len:149 (+) Transcript_10553:188-634(+)
MLNRGQEISSDWKRKVEKQITFDRSHQSINSIKESIPRAALYVLQADFNYPAFMTAFSKIFNFGKLESWNKRKFSKLVLSTSSQNIHYFQRDSFTHDELYRDMMLHIWNSLENFLVDPSRVVVSQDTEWVSEAYWFSTEGPPLSVVYE